MLTAFLRGRCAVRVPGSCETAFLNLLLRSGTVYRELSHTDGEICAVVPHAQAERLRCLLGAEGIEARVVSLSGLPHLFRRLRRRAGLWIGLAASAALLLLSGRVIWDISIIGNERVSEAEIRALLAAEGVRVGTRRAAVDTDTVEAEIMHKSAELSWMSINISGTVAFVEVREEQPPAVLPPSYPDADGINLVASRDGVLLGYILSAGQPVPSPGSAVRAGELLVSGVTETPHRGMLIQRAAGEVMALTERSVRVTLPLVSTDRIPERREIRGISLIFFDFEQKIFKKYGNDPLGCDTIIVNKYVYHSKDRTIPVGLALETAVGWSEQERRRSPEEVRALAALELNRAAAAETAGCEIVSREITEELTDSTLTLCCRITCIEDIAAEAPVYFRDPVPSP